MVNITIPYITDIFETIIIKPVTILVEATYDIVTNRIIRIRKWAGRNVSPNVTCNYSSSICETWSAAQPENIGKIILKRVSRIYPCPPTIDQVKKNDAFEENFLPLKLLKTKFFDRLYRECFHPGSFACYRQKGGFE